jgi:hypothetical protein
MAMIAAASMTHDKGFHIKPRNFSILFSYSRIEEYKRIQSMRETEQAVMEK